MSHPPLDKSFEDFKLAGGTWHFRIYDFTALPEIGDDLWFWLAISALDPGQRRDCRNAARCAWLDMAEAALKCWSAERADAFRISSAFKCAANAPENAAAWAAYRWEAGE